MKEKNIVTLETHLVDIFRLTPTQKTGLSKLNIETTHDLLYYFPSRYETQGSIKTIEHIAKGEHATIYGRVVSTNVRRSFKTKIPMSEAVIEDSTGKIKAVWFHQAYMVKKIPPKTMVKLSGKIENKNGTLYMTNPEISQIENVPTETEDTLWGNTQNIPILPIYPETKGVSSSFLYHHVEKLFSLGILEHTQEIIPEDILHTYHLPTLKTALVWIHAPQKNSDAVSARKRFAFEEVFSIQLAQKRERSFYKSHETFSIKENPETLNAFISRFPFTPTGGQMKALGDILLDFQKDKPMARLLEGDVGSGKTFVAATSAYMVATSSPHENKYGNLQVAYMAPTEILAKQHFKSFIEYFRGLSIEIGLLTGSTCKKFPSKVDPSGATTVSRTQLLKWVEGGAIPILIGTHALIQKSVVFKNLALAIVDEQHRFGTIQRKSLARKHDIVPHFLSMTATPIPRTLALTIYGNLDLTLLEEMPTGRLPIKTELVTSKNRRAVEDAVRTEINKGRQVYVICPRIDEPDPEKELALNVKSVVEEATRLKEKIFSEFKIDILHGKMQPKEKDEVMSRFAHGNIDILIATSVVEVGVNVPNATVILIEGAERFGLASLHQLRGRVMRSTHQPYCYLLPTNTNENSIKRLKALASAKNGFQLAELDLSLRGAGELGGGKQWGISDLGMEALKNIKMVEAARNEAQKIIDADPTLKHHPLLLEHITKTHHSTHWE